MREGSEKITGKDWAYFSTLLSHYRDGLQSMSAETKARLNVGFMV